MIKATTLNNLTNLSQLVQFTRPLELVNVDRDREDNAEVLEFINGFLEVIDAELRNTKVYKQYVFGEKDSFIRKQFASRFELVASRMIEKRVMACSTTDFSEQDFIQEEFNLYRDLYYLLLTSFIDVVALRQQGFEVGGLGDVIKLFVAPHLEEMADYPELEVIFNALDQRKNQYPNDPALQDTIRKLLDLAPAKEDGFIFATPKPVNEYNTGETLVQIIEDSDIDQISLGDLPEGLTFNENDGSIFVSDPSVLKAGLYSVIAYTTDELGGQTTHHLQVRIGDEKVPEYQVATYKNIKDYFDQDVLAQPTFSEGGHPLEIAEWVTDKYTVPPGVELDAETGIVSVSSYSLLKVGVFPVVVKLTNTSGRESLHEFSLSFRQDVDAIYKYNQVKPIDQYQLGDIIATVSDDDGEIVSADKNELPSGLTIDSTTGNVVVDNADLLQPGTHLFNVLALNTDTNVSSIKTLYVQLDEKSNPFTYDSKPIYSIGGLDSGDVVATLTSSPSTIPDKVNLIEGTLPLGTSFDESGNLVVNDPSLIEAGNYNICVQICVGDTSSQIEEITASIQNSQKKLDAVTEDLITAQEEKQALLIEIATVESNGQYQIIQVQNELAATQEQLNNATNPDEQEELTAKVQQLTAVIAEMTAALENQIAEMQEQCEELQAKINELQEVAAKLQNEITALSLEIIEVKNNGSEEYELCFFITFEADRPSTWHIEIPKDWDEYANNELIAQAIDCDGVESVEILSGSLPSGTFLDTEKGTVLVTDKTQLSPGEYILNTKITDVNSSELDIRLGIIICGDSENSNEEYIQLPAKPISNYQINEILAYPYNPEYEVVGARITKGLLPNGVGINSVTGELRVVSTEVLTAGLYSGIEIKTTNSSGGVTYHTVDLDLQTSVEFEFIYNEVNQDDEFQVGDVLGYVQVTGGVLQGASLLSGALLPGTALNTATGEVFVVDVDALAFEGAGFTLLVVETNGGTDQLVVEGPGDGNGGGSGNGELGVVSWGLNIPVLLSEIGNGDEVAAAFISNKSIVDATSSQIPNGLALQSTGELVVVDSSLLAVGGYEIPVTLTDNDNNQYSTYIYVPIQASDEELGQLIWDLNVPVDTSADTGTVVATPTISNSEVVNAEAQGLPPALTISQEGVITVVNSALLPLFSGPFEVSVQLTDANGFQYFSFLYIVIGGQSTGSNPGTVSWTVNTPIDLSQIDNGFEVAIPEITNANGASLAIQTATILGATPQGFEIDPGDGKITVEDPSQLTVGEVGMSVQLIDDNGNSYSSFISVSIVNGASVPPSELNWQMNVPVFIDTATTGLTVAVPSLNDNVAIIGATSFEVPSGMSLAGNGILTVSSVSQLQAQDSVVSMKLTDENGNIYSTAIYIPVYQSANSTGGNSVDLDLIEEDIAPIKPYFHWVKDDDILLSFTPEGAVTSASLIGGNYPAGTGFRGDSGEVFVSNKVSLTRNDRNLTIEIANAAGDTKVVPVEIDNVAVPKFSNLDAGAAFILSWPDRMKKWQDELISNSDAWALYSPAHNSVNEFVQGAILPQFSQSEPPTEAPNILSGEFDSQISDGGVTLINIVKNQYDNISLTAPGGKEAKFATLELLNELVISMVGLTTYRESDIDQGSDIWDMYDVWDPIIEVLSVDPEDFVRGNVRAMYRYVPTSLSNLRSQVNKIRF